MTTDAYNAHLRSLGPHESWQITETVEDSDLVSRAVDFVPGKHKMQFHNGPTIAHPRLVLIRVGPQWWADWAKFVQFATELMANGYLAKLDYAGCTSGTFAGSYEGPPLSGTQSDAQLQGYLRGVIAAGTVPPPDSATIYSLMLPAGVTVTLDADSSCSAFCGYHSSMDGGAILYTVQPASNCQGCNQGDAFVGATMVEAHEVAETISDPTGAGWYEDSSGMENADIVAWIQKSYGPWTVQGYADPAGNNVLGDYVQAPVQPPPGPPPSGDGWQQQAEAAVQPVVDRYAALLKRTPRSTTARYALQGAQAALDAVKAAPA